MSASLQNRSVAHAHDAMRVAALSSGVPPQMAWNMAAQCRAAVARLKCNPRLVRELESKGRQGQDNSATVPWRIQ